MMIETVEISCYSCGIAFWISKKFNTRLLETKEGFYCPTGHYQCYVGKSDAARLRDLRIEKDAEIARIKAELADALKPKRKRKQHA